MPAGAAGEGLGRLVGVVDGPDLAGAVAAEQRQLLAERFLHGGQLLVVVLELASTACTVEGERGDGLSFDAVERFGRPLVGGGDDLFVFVRLTPAE